MYFVCLSAAVVSETFKLLSFPLRSRLAVGRITAMTSFMLRQIRPSAAETYSVEASSMQLA